MVGLLDGGDRDEDCDNIGLGCALGHFSEVEEVMSMIDNVKNIYQSPQIESQYDKLYTILKQYYEQPHLLDPHLDKILGKFLGYIKDKDSPVDLKHAIFNYMYQIIRVRGYKVVVRHLPHEVSDLITVLTFLEAQDPKDKETWRSRFVLLLWLSIVIIIPFHMSRLDGFTPGSSDDDGKTVTVMERIFNICKIYAQSRDTCAEASAYLASKFLTRSDVKELYMSPFFDWACELNSNLQEESSIQYGVLAAVAAVLKHGKRDDLLPYASKLLAWVTAQNFQHNSAMLVRKYGVKIVQRICLTFLRPRVAAWRYTRGSRSLGAAFGAASGDTTAAVAPPAPAVEDDDEDIPQEVEDAVELLLFSLRDEDTVVRWSCAKGLGRAGARLPAAAAADVADCALGLCRDSERDSAWHGACLATAELGRRGLLSPAQLGTVVSCISRALRRDEPRAAGGGGGGGRAARDAACHAAWALARAYDAAALAPHATLLANSLIATALFDREINCRRAASAAFQENVGRHGMFPHGIDVLTAADFQSVGPRTGAYLAIAPQVAAYQEYTRPLIDHLVELKVPHWDCAIRELAAKSLHNITDKLPEYMATSVLPTLVEKTESVDLNARHGAILAIGEVYLALSQCNLPNGSPASSLVSPDILSGAAGVTSRLRARRQLRGPGGELLRQASCQCVAALARAEAPYHDLPVIDEWLSLIEECLSHEVASIRAAAANALPLVVSSYLSAPGAAPRRAELIDSYCRNLASTAANGLYVRMGFARAVGSLPKPILMEHLPTIIRSLIECTKVTESTQKWAEARRDAVTGLTEVCQTVGAADCDPYIEQVMEALLECLSEYTVDMRGDIGAWVREASLTGLLAVSRLCAAAGGRAGGRAGPLVARAVRGAAQQAVEKIDRTRAHAGRVFTAFVHNEPVISGIPQHEALKRIFPLEEIELKPTKSEEEIQASESSNVVLWLFPGHTMPRFVQLLDFPEYRYSIVKGLVVSAGELTESLVKHTTAALFEHLRGLSTAALAAVCDTIVEVFADNLHVKRITGPMFNFLDRLLSSGAISPILEDPQSLFAGAVLRCLQRELSSGRNIYKLLDSINVLCQLIQVGGEVSSRCLSRLCVCVCHADRYVRRCAAARLYEALALYGDSVPGGNVEQVMSILAETDWEKDVAELRPIRNGICDLLGIKQPVLKQKNP